MKGLCMYSLIKKQTMRQLISLKNALNHYNEIPWIDNGYWGEILSDSTILASEPIKVV